MENRATESKKSGIVIGTSGAGKSFYYSFAFSKMHAVDVQKGAADK